MRRVLLRVCLGLGICLAHPSPSTAQEAGAENGGDTAKIAAELTPLSASERTQLIAKLSDEQSRELLLQYLSQTAPANPETRSTGTARLAEGFTTNAHALRENLLAVAGAAASVLPAYSMAARERLHLQDTGIAMVVFYLLVLVGAGLLCEYAYHRLATKPLSRYTSASPATTTKRLKGALLLLIYELAGIAVFALGYFVVFLAFWGGDVSRRNFAVLVLVAILIARSIPAVLSAIFLPKLANWRIMPVDDDAAGPFMRGARRLSFLGVALLFWCTIGLIWDVAANAVRFSALISAVLFTAASIGFIWRYRTHLARMAERSLAQHGGPHWAGAVFGWSGPLLAIAYVFGAFLLGVFNLLLSQPYEPWTAVAGFLALFILYPYLTAILIEMFITPGEKAHAGLAFGETVRPETGTGQSAATLAGNPTLRRAESDEAARATKGVDRRVLRHVISATVFVLCLSVFVSLVGIDVYSKASEYPAAAFVLRVLLNIGVMALLGYAAWALIAGWIDRKLLEEHAKAPKPVEDAEGPAMESGSRLETILPLLRKFLRISITVVAVMVILSSLGVNIAPLIAGAGVIGLAVGFGAQTLVKDVISGLFFLMDDAFRIGEYIECGDVNGTVERFNARSIVLRGYLGALYTVPYGELGKVTNYSRDWAMMKLSFRVPYDTDINLVRKIFKKIGQEMMDDPELGPYFIQPFKSQGVTKMDDSAFIIRGKFMTKPNKQFAVRKAVYEKVQQAFRDNGISFAPKRVIVDVPRGEGEHVGEGNATPQRSASTFRIAAAAAAAAGDAPQKG